MAEQRTEPPKPTPAPAASAGPRTGDIVLVRQDIRNVIPAIVTNDYAGQNTSGVVAVVSFTAAPYGGSPFNLVPNCQPETKDTPAEDLISTFQGYWMLPSDNALRLRDLENEIKSHKEQPVAETKPAP